MPKLKRAPAGTDSWHRIFCVFYFVMLSKQKNFAYIDGANLHKGIGDLGWKLDYRRFRVWLKEKYSVEKAYIFIGLVPKYKDTYTFLQEAGYTLVFKETTYDGAGNVKGNCDADLVLWAVRDAYAPIVYLERQKSILAYNKKAPDRDGTRRGSFS